MYKCVEYVRFDICVQAMGPRLDANMPAAPTQASKWHPSIPNAPAATSKNSPDLVAVPPALPDKYLLATPGGTPIVTCQLAPETQFPEDVEQPDLKPKCRTAWIWNPMSSSGTLQGTQFWKLLILSSRSMSRILTAVICTIGHVGCSLIPGPLAKQEPNLQKQHQLYNCSSTMLM